VDHIQSSLTGSAGPSSALPSAGRPSDYRGNSDNASIMSKRSALSLRLGPPAYIEDLKASRAYKRLRHFGLGIDSSADSVLTFDSGCSAGNWSMLSNMTLGDLSVSQIAVLNLPIDLSDVCNPEPFLEPSSTETHRSSRPKPRRIWSSRGRIHNAIENGNEFVVRTLLTMGMDIEELDSNGRTPLVHAIMKDQEATCKLLLEKGASVEPLKAFTTNMDLKERSELLDPLITRALDDGTSSVFVAVLRLLVQMALGTHYGDDNQSSGRSMMRAAIDVGYGLAVRAIIHLEPRVVVEVDTEGRTPLVHATMQRQEAISKLLLEKGSSVEPLKAFTTDMDLKKRSELLDPFITRALDDGAPPVYVAVLRLLVQMALGTNYGDDNRSSGRSMMNAAIDLGYDSAVRAIIDLEPQVLVEADTAGRTPFAYAYHLRRNEICEILLQSSKVDTEIATKVVKLEGDFARRVHAVILEKCPRLLRLQLLSIFAMGVDVEETGIKGQTPLAHLAEVVLNSEDINYESWNYIFEALLYQADTKIMEKIRLQPGAHRCLTASMHELVQTLFLKDYKPILVLLSLMKSHDTAGWTLLASAAFNLDEDLCEFLVEKGCSLCLDTEQKEQLKPKLSYRIHVAAKCGHKTALQLLLDLGADINKRNSRGQTALLEAVDNNHLPCVQILTERGADATVLTNEGYSVLHCAAWRSTDSEMMKFLLDEVETQKLVNMKNSNGNTPLHDCSYWPPQSPVVRVENARMLLQAGASLTIRNRNGRTPYEYARGLRRAELTKYLWSKLSPKQQAQEQPPPSNW